MLPPLSPGVKVPVSIPCKCNSAASLRSTGIRDAALPPWLLLPYFPTSAPHFSMKMGISIGFPHSLIIVLTDFSLVAASTINLVASSPSKPAINDRVRNLFTNSAASRFSPSSDNQTKISICLSAARRINDVTSSGKFSESSSSFLDFLLLAGLFLLFMAAGWALC